MFALTEQHPAQCRTWKPWLRTRFQYVWAGQAPPSPTAQSLATDCGFWLMMSCCKTSPLLENWWDHVFTTDSHKMCLTSPKCLLNRKGIKIKTNPAVQITFVSLFPTRIQVISTKMRPQLRLMILTGVGDPLSSVWSRCLWLSLPPFPLAPLCPAVGLLLTRHAPACKALTLMLS